MKKAPAQLTKVVLKPILFATAFLLSGEFVCFDPAVIAQQVPPQGSFTMAQTISDGAQRTTLAFDGLAIMTGNLDAQSFFPPGKVADYTGFQYLRDNDPDNMGHNTSFLTRIANNVIYLLTDSQLTQLVALAGAQQDQVSQYGYERFPLMQAFRRLVDGNIPAGATGLNLSAVKEVSRGLYLLDGQISFDRAVLYSKIYSSMNASQIAYLDAMKGHGWNSWPDITDAQVSSKMRQIPQGMAVAVMTYASDLFSWYVGSADADIYFCPERHGTYYGGFYIKDAPAVGHEGYSISEQLTATAGAALSDGSLGYVTSNQAVVMSSLVGLQRNNLYAGVTNIVWVRTQIDTLLRGLRVSRANTNSVQAQVLALSSVYGDLDGEDNYYYATVLAEVYHSMTADQKNKIMTLRQSIMSGTYADGTPFDFTVCNTPFLYSDMIANPSVLTPYISDTDYLFNVPTSTLTLATDAGVDGGTLPIDYTADGYGISPALSWSNAPAGTQQFVVTLTTMPGDGTTRWNWLLWNIPATTNRLDENTTVGTVGASSDYWNGITNFVGYAPPQSQGPGVKVYKFTVYALSAAPVFSVPDNQVTGAVLTQAIASITLGSASLSLSYARTAPVAAFTYAQNDATVAFTNAAGLSALAWVWDFGDGGKSTAENPSHTYAASGSYWVALTVSNAFGTNIATQSVTVTKSTLALPRIVPNGGTFVTSALRVTLSCATVGATIRYTTDGADPTITSTAYAKTAIALTNSVTFKAKAFKGSAVSGVATATFTIIVPPAITTTSLPKATMQQSYSGTLTVAGGAAPFQWALAAGSRLPLGVTLNTLTGSIAGLPTRAGTSRFTVTVTDTNNRRATKSLAITVGN